jgi:hypothetical protein
MVFKDVGKFSTSLCKQYKVYIGTLAAAIVIGIYEYYSYTHLPVGYNSNEDILPVDIATGIIALVQMVLSIWLFIAFFRFLHRVSKNLRFKFQKEMKFTPGWTVGYFFIPILNLFKPYQAIKEMWTTANNNKPINAALLSNWWVLWLISNIVGRVVFKYTVKNWATYPDLHGTLLYIISDSIDLVTYILEFKLIKTIAQAYIANYESGDAVQQPQIVV